MPVRRLIHMSRTALALGAAGLALLIAGCGQNADPTSGPTAGPAEKEGATGPCPAGLSAGELTDATELGSADVDGDGSVDDVAMGAFPGGGADCTVAVVVTAAEDTYAAPVAGATETVGEQSLAEPTFAQIDGMGGEEVVVTTSWSPRGGGALSMFSFVNGELVQVSQGGKPWSVFGTVDDDGGSPQLLACVDGGFVHATTPDPRATVSELTAYSLSAGEVSELRGTAAEVALPQYVRDTYPGMPESGLAVFDDCG